MNRIIGKNIFLIAAITIPLTIYLLTSPHSPVAFGDSDELTTAGYYFGLPHPPGYPLLNILIYIFTHLPIPVSVAFKANLVSIISASLGISVFFLLCRKVLAFFNQNPNSNLSIEKLKNTKQFNQLTINFLSLSLSLFLAFTPLFWTYAIVTEVFALDMLLALLIVLLSLNLKSDWHAKMWYCLCLCIGLSLAHQQKTLLIIIPSLVFLYQQLKSYLSAALKGLGIILIVPIILYSVLFTGANQYAPQSWQVEYSPNGIWGYLTRADYKAKHENNAYLPNINFFTNDNLESFSNFYLKDLILQLSLPLILLAIFGLYLIFRFLPKSKAYYLSIIFVLSAPFIGLYLTVPLSSPQPAYQTMIQAITQRMYLLGLPFWILLIAISLYFILINMKSRFKIVLLVLLPLFQLATHYQNQNLASYDSISSYCQNVLTKLPANAVLTCFSDISCFSLINVQSIDNIRPDISIVPVTGKMQNYVRQKNPDLFKYSYSINPQRMGAAISWALYENKQVFAAELPPDYIEFMGLDGQAFYLTARDLVFEISKQPQVYIPSANDFEMNPFNIKSTQPFVQTFKLTLFEQYAKNGTLLARQGLKQPAGEYYLKALKLNPNEPTVTQLLLNLSNYQGDPEYIAINKAKNMDDILATINDCEPADQVCLIHRYQLASFIQPDNVIIRRLLLDLYNKQSIDDLVKDEGKIIENLSGKNSF